MKTNWAETETKKRSSEIDYDHVIEKLKKTVLDFPVEEGVTLEQKLKQACAFPAKPNYDYPAHVYEVSNQKTKELYHLDLFEAQKKYEPLLQLVDQACGAFFAERFAPVKTGAWQSLMQSDALGLTQAESFAFIHALREEMAKTLKQAAPNLTNVGSEVGCRA